MKKEIISFLKPRLALLLAVAMVFSMLPVSAFAADITAPTTTWDSQISGSFTEVASTLESYTHYSVVNGEAVPETVTIDTTATLGSKTNPIAISSPEDLILFGKQGKDRAAGYSENPTYGKYYILTEEVYDMGAHAMNPLSAAAIFISYTSYICDGFCGTLIGNGATIQNAYIVGGTSAMKVVFDSYVGNYNLKVQPALFSSLYGGKVWDLTMKDCTVSGGTGGMGMVYAAGTNLTADAVVNVTVTGGNMIPNENITSLSLLGSNAVGSTAEVTLAENYSLQSDLTLYSGQTLTIPEGVTLSVLEPQTLTVKSGAELINNGTIAGTVTVEDGGVLSGTGDSHIHSGGTASCIAKAVCDICQMSYGPLSEKHPFVDGVCPLCNVNQEIRIDMVDPRYSGWGSTGIKVFADGEELATASFASGRTGTWTTTLEYHTAYSFQWVAGSSPYERSFTISVNGKEKISGEGYNLSNGATILTLEPYCTGEFENCVCTECGFVCGTDAAHSFDETKTCTRCGFACGVDADHAWNEGVCSVCGQNCQHTGGTATCTELAVCKQCGEAYGSLAAHTPNDAADACTACGATLYRVSKYEEDDRLRFLLFQGPEYAAQGQDYVGRIIMDLDYGVIMSADFNFQVWVGGVQITEYHFYNTVLTIPAHLVTGDILITCEGCLEKEPDTLPGTCPGVIGGSLSHEGFVWAEDYSSCVVRVCCGLCDEISENTYTPSVSTTAATCAEPGKTVYSVSIRDITDSKEVAIPIDESNHDYVDSICTRCGEKQYPIFLGDVQITDDNSADILGDGTASFDGATNTLTLNGATVDMTQINQTYIDELNLKYGEDLENGREPEVLETLLWISALEITGGELTLELIGDNSLIGLQDVQNYFGTDDFYGVPAISVADGASLTVIGEDAATLTLVGSDFDYTVNDHIHSASAITGGSLTVEGGTITTGNGIRLGGDYTQTGGIVKVGYLDATNVTVSNGELESSGHNGIYPLYSDVDADGIHGIFAQKTITVSGGTIITAGGTVGHNGEYRGGRVTGELITTHGLYALESITISGGTVTSTGGSGGYYVDDQGYLIAGMPGDPGAAPAGSALEAPSWSIDQEATFTCGSDSSHRGGTATCTELAVCDFCGMGYGALDTDNHVQSNGICGCGESCEGAVLNDQGVYEISNAGQLFWFAKFVNAGNGGVNAVLLNDIDLEGRAWTPMGSTTVPYTGTFDGQGNAITGFKLDITTGGDWGLFGFASDATVKNFSISGEAVSNLTEAPTDAFDYGVIGEATGSLVVTDVHSSVNFTSNDTQYKNTVSGILGRNNSTGADFAIERCSFSGKLDLGAAQVDCTGGILAYAMAGHAVKINNCLFDGQIVSTYNGALQIGGMMGYYRLAKLTITNCLSIGTITTTDSSVNGMLVGVLRQHGSANTMVANNYYTGTQPFGNSGQTDDITDGYGSQTVAGSAALVTEAQLTSGEIAYKLGEAWGQTLGTDTVPTLGGEKVYQVLDCDGTTTVYRNVNENVEHSYDYDCDTDCNHCGAVRDAEHAGGTATCTEQAACQYCGQPYGDLRSDNHTGPYTEEFDWYPYEDGTCYVSADLYCDSCDGYVDGTSGDAELTQDVTPVNCQNPGSRTWSFTCTLNGQEYSETYTETVYNDTHIVFDGNGFCTSCGGYQKPTVDPGEDPEWEYDDVYLIYNAGQLFWFANYVNNVNNGAAGKLMANIDLNPGYTFNADGTYTGGDSPRTWTPIGSGSLCYSGAFDGNGFTVSGAYTVSDGSYVGLFGNTDYNYEIKNLGITNSYFAGSDHVGGLAGYAYTYIYNCYVTDTVYVSGGYPTGGLVGYSGVEIHNSYAMADTLVGQNVGTVVNSYYLGTEDTDDIDGTTALTADQFASGEAAYLLQSGVAGEDVYDDEGNYVETVTPEIWGQTLGEDAYPVIGGEKVYENRTEYCAEGTVVEEYSNTQLDLVTIHSFDEETLLCVCGAVSPDAVASVSLDGSTTYYTSLSDAILAANTLTDEGRVDAGVQLVLFADHTKEYLSDDSDCIWEGTTFVINEGVTLTVDYLTIRDEFINNGTVRSVENSNLSAGSSLRFNHNYFGRDTLISGSGAFHIPINSNGGVINGGTFYEEVDAMQPINGGTFYETVTISAMNHEINGGSFQDIILKQDGCVIHYASDAVSVSGTVYDYTALDFASVTVEGEEHTHTLGEPVYRDDGEDIHTKMLPCTDCPITLYKMVEEEHTYENGYCACGRAEYYQILVDGVQITADNCSDVLGDGTVSYDAAANTLTLNNANIQDGSFTMEGSTMGVAICCERADGMNMELVGENHITAGPCPELYSVAVLVTSGDLTVSGTGTLTALGGDGLMSCGLVVSGVFTLNEGATVTASGVNILPHKTDEVIIFGTLNGLVGMTFNDDLADNVWNGLEVYGTVTLEKDLTIAEQSEGEVGVMTIHEGATLTIPDGVTLTVNESVLTTPNSIVNNGSVLLEGTGTVVNNGTGTCLADGSNHLWQEGKCLVCHTECTHIYDNTCDTDCNLCGVEREIEHTEEIVPGYGASCTEDGLTDGTRCSVCGETLTAQQIIPATGHTEQTLDGYDATCTEEGLTDGTYCSVCGETLTAHQIIPATGHTEESISGYDATCTEEGLTDGTYCFVCGEILTEQQIIPATGHTEETVPGTAATCTQDGLTDGVSCSVCGTILTEQVAIPSPGHTEQIISGYEQTCTEDGLTDGSVCTVCGETTLEQEVIPASHSWMDADCYDAKTCSVCGETEGEPLGHTEGETVTFILGDPTCTETGSEQVLVYCSVCGGEISNDIVTLPATGHTDEDGDNYCDVCGGCIVHTNEDGDNVCDICGGCIEHTFDTGYYNGPDANGHYRVCDNCDYYDADTLAPHTYEEGYYEYDEENHYLICDICGYYDIDSPAAHTYDDDSDYYCNDCGYCRCAHDGESWWDGDLYEHFLTCGTCNETFFSDSHMDGSDEDTLCDDCGFETATVTVYFDNSGSQWEIVRCYWLREGEEGYKRANEISVEDGVYTLELPADAVQISFMNYYPGQPEDEVSGGYQFMDAAVEAGKTYVYAPDTGCAHIEEIVPGYAAGCENSGLTDGVICSECGETLTAQEVIPATGHTEGETTESVLLEPGCDYDGEKRIIVYCSVCGGEISNEIVYLPAVGHTEQTIPATAATCTTYGWTEGVECSVCGEILTEQEIIPMLDHSYDDDGVCTVCGYTYTPIQLQYPTLSFRDEIVYNIYYSVENMPELSLDDMGLILFDGANVDGTMDDAIQVIPGATVSSSGYIVSSCGIPAKEMGDTIYFKVYARQADGSYVYSKLGTYSAINYAQQILHSDYGPEVKAVVVAMLNYGAAAQSFFNYKTDALMNAVLTEEELDLVAPFSSDMITPVGAVDSGKLGAFADNGGFASRYPSVSFEGAFAINYYFTPSNPVSGDMTLYYWTQEDYEAAAELTADNATGKLTMTGETTYSTRVEGIAAKDLSDTVYVAVTYSDGTADYCSGILAYSVAAYCGFQIDMATSAQALAEATAVYGYYCKAMFEAE